MMETISISQQQQRSNMGHQKFWQRLSGPNLFRLVVTVSALCISYEGMSQGIMGAVTVAPEFGVGQIFLTRIKSSLV